MLVLVYNGLRGIQVPDMRSTLLFTIRIDTMIKVNPQPDVQIQLFYASSLSTIHIKFLISLSDFRCKISTFPPRNLLNKAITPASGATPG